MTLLTTSVAISEQKDHREGLGFSAYMAYILIYYFLIANNGASSVARYY